MRDSKLKLYTRNARGDLQSVQQERVLDFSKTIRDFQTFFLKIKVLSKYYGATT